jgi:hypothetical protein
VLENENVSDKGFIDSLNGIHMRLHWRSNPYGHLNAKMLLFVLTQSQTPIADYRILYQLTSCR